MSLNDLPDNCLWKILENVHEFEELIQLSKVCSRWSDLITMRFNRVKYLQTMDITSNKVDYIDENILWMDSLMDWHDDWNLIEFFPNLKIIDMGPLFYYADLLEIVKNNPQIKGLIGYLDFFRRIYDLSNIEMFASEFNFDYKKVFRPDQLKQVHGRYFDISDLPSFIEYFPNLKRLHLELSQADGVFYNGPNLSSLKILELGTDKCVRKFTGFHLMDFCPSLESAFFACRAKDIYVDESIKNYNLRDLVIENIQSSKLSWPLLKRVLSKFPNLLHLAIRNFDQLDDSNVEKLINLLPELKLLDLRGFKNVKHKSADFLSKFCVKENRSIVIYYSCKNEPTEWPKLVETREKIVYGFDFMKHCFYKTWRSLPTLIDE